MEDESTHLYFDGNRQGVQLFIQFFEDNQFFQCEAAESVQGREWEVTGVTDIKWT